LNETIEIAAEHSSPWNDFFTRSDFNKVQPYNTAYVVVQPRMNALLGYTYRLAIQRGKSLLLVPADFSDKIPETFLITKDGLRKSQEQNYREWSSNHDGQRLHFRNG